MQVNVLGAERPMQVNVLGAERRRRQARQGRLGGNSVRTLVPVEITRVVAPIPSDAPQPASSPPAQRERAGIIEIELSGGCRVRVDRDVDVEALQRVLEPLRRR